MSHLVYNFGICSGFKIGIFLQNWSNTHPSFLDVEYLFHVITVMLTLVHLRYPVFEMFVFSAR